MHPYCITTTPPSPSHFTRVYQCTGMAFRAEIGVSYAMYVSLWLFSVNPHELHF